MHFPLIQMNRLNETEYAGLTFCSFSLFLLDLKMAVYRNLAPHPPGGILATMIS